jgi:hypothetical protein
MKSPPTTARAPEEYLFTISPGDGTFVADERKFSRRAMMASTLLGSV